MNRFLAGTGIFAAAAMALTVKGLAAEHTKDPLGEVKMAVEGGRAILIDVQEPDEWTDGHLKHAKHLSLSDLQKGVSKEKLKALIPPGKVIYLHCAAGGRCLKAADLLKKAGYETRPLRPGYNDLLEAGFAK